MREGPDIRKELASIAIHDAKDLPDYINRAGKISLLIPRLEAFYRQGGATLSQLRKKYHSRPDLLQLADFIQRLNERDVFGCQLLKEEVRLAAMMPSMSPDQQQAFYKAKIVPLQQVEDNVADEEISMAKDAVNRGLALPNDIVDSITQQGTGRTPTR